jgi:hypothetical protein
MLPVGVVLGDPEGRPGDTVDVIVGTDVPFGDMTEVGFMIDVYATLSHKCCVTVIEPSYEYLYSAQYGAVLAVHHRTWRGSDPVNVRAALEATHAVAISQAEAGSRASQKPCTFASLQV